MHVYDASCHAMRQCVYVHCTPDFLSMSVTDTYTYPENRSIIQSLTLYNVLSNNVHSLTFPGFCRESLGMRLYNTVHTTLQFGCIIGNIIG